jgi:hypothetical protein
MRLGLAEGVPLKINFCGLFLYDQNNVLVLIYVAGWRSLND